MDPEGGVLVLSCCKSRSSPAC